VKVSVGGGTSDRQDEPAAKDMTDPQPDIRLEIVTDEDSGPHFVHLPVLE